LKDRPDQDDEQLSQQHHHMWNVLTFTSRKVEVVISTLLRKKTVNVLKARLKDSQHIQLQREVVFFWLIKQSEMHNL
jgi:hypothetical protein